MNNVYLKVLAALFFVCTILFYDVMFTENIFLSPDAISAKSISHGIQKSEIKDGSYPLWMPWIFGGIPSTHSMQNISEYYFPHSLLSYIKTIGIPWFWNFLVHFLFCGLGMFLFLNILKLNFHISLLGGILFMISPYMVTMIVHGHGSQVMTAAYIPWVMWGIIRLKKDQSIKNIGILALLIGLQLQRAHFQIAYYTWGMMVLYLLFYAISDYLDKKDINLKFYLNWLCSSILGFCMSLWIIIPLLNYASLSNRSISNGGSSFQYATAWSMHPYELLTMIFPSSYGFGDATYYGFMPFTNFPNYGGVVLIIAAMICFLDIHKKKRGRILLISFSHFYTYIIWKVFSSL